MSIMNSELTLTGHVTVTLNGEVVQEIPNLVVSSGKGFVTSRMKDATTNVMSHMAVGSGSSAAAAGDAALGSEITRVALTSTSVSNNAITYVASFPAGTGTGGLTEAGILNATSGGDLLCRTVFAIVNKNANDAMSISWTITAS